MVTDLDYLKVCIPVLDISGLKVHCTSSNKASFLMATLASNTYLMPHFGNQYLCHCCVVFISSQFKERDLLEGIFKFWRSPDNTTFDTKKHWWVGVVSFCNHTPCTTIPPFATTPLSLTFSLAGRDGCGIISGPVTIAGAGCSIGTAR